MSATALLRAEQESVRRRHRHLHVGQPVPLRHLSANPHGHQVRGPGPERECLMNAVIERILSARHPRTARKRRAVECRSSLNALAAARSAAAASCRRPSPWAAAWCWPLASVRKMPMRSRRRRPVLPRPAGPPPGPAFNPGAYVTHRAGWKDHAAVEEPGNRPGHQDCLRRHPGRRAGCQVVRCHRRTGADQFGRLRRAVRWRFAVDSAWPSTRCAVLALALAPCWWPLPPRNGACRRARSPRPNSVVTHAASNRSMSYGQLATAAAAMPVPNPQQLKLKDRKDWKIMGTRVTGVDNVEAGDRPAVVRRGRAAAQHEGGGVPEVPRRGRQGRHGQRRRNPQAAGRGRCLHRRRHGPWHRK